MPKSKPVQVAKKGFSKLIQLIGWITGVLVALAVGFGMKDGILVVPYVEEIVPAAGWVVIILAIVGAILAIIDKLR